MTLTILLHFAATWAMLGLIWFIQLNHYPLFSLVGREEFSDYQVAHMRRTTWVVAPFMCIEAITGALLLWAPPSGVSIVSVWVGMALLAVIWGSTAALQVPRHRDLLDGFDADAHRSLVASNWIRTIAWTIRGMLSGYWIWQVSSIQ